VRAGKAEGLKASVTTNPVLSTLPGATHTLLLTVPGGWDIVNTSLQTRKQKPQEVKGPTYGRIHNSMLFKESQGVIMSLPLH
jgi:hypothetical protein